ncbi:MAG: hypothetical protein KAS77_00800 [Thermoplasmata archaeon]|nr:hypothetical protein [Thermoplasmata archaeon]
MFEKWESKTYPGVNAMTIHTHAFQWWNAAGFAVMETGPGQFRGVAASKWGLEREVNISVKDMNGTTVVELRMKANVTTEGILAGGIALVLLWPVAVVGGAYSYAKYEHDARDLITSFWNSIATVAQSAPIDHKEEVVHTTAVPQEEVQIAAQPPIAATMLSKEDKLSLLEDRLAKGEVSEETYIAIKTRLDE